MRRLAERPPELAAEVRGRKMCGACERRNVEGVAIARVDEVLRTQQMSGGWMADHRSHEYREGRPSWAGFIRPLRSC